MTRQASFVAALVFYLPSPSRMSYAVSIKHAGKVYQLALDTSQPPAAFKQSIYEACGVPPDRQKVMLKAAVLKVSRLVLAVYWVLKAYWIAIGRRGLVEDRR
jgi:hypothetical protein